MKSYFYSCSCNLQVDCFDWPGVQPPENLGR